MSTIPIVSFTHSNAPVNVANENGNALPGTKHSTRSQTEFAQRSWKTDVTRSCITWAGLEKMDSQNEFSLPGASTVTTHTQTSARPAAAKVINSGWDSIARVPITRMRK